MSKNILIVVSLLIAFLGCGTQKGPEETYGTCNGIEMTKAEIKGFIDQSYAIIGSYNQTSYDMVDMLQSLLTNIVLNGIDFSASAKDYELTFQEGVYSVESTKSPASILLTLYRDDAVLEYNLFSLDSYLTDINTDLVNQTYTAEKGPLYEMIQSPPPLQGPLTLDLFNSLKIDSTDLYFSMKSENTSEGGYGGYLTVIMETSILSASEVINEMNSVTGVSFNFNGTNYIDKSTDTDQQFFDTELSVTTDEIGAYWLGEFNSTLRRGEITFAVNGAVSTRKQNSIYYSCAESGEEFGEMYKIFPKSIDPFWRFKFTKAGWEWDL